jgi:hypothetical protein
MSKLPTYCSSLFNDYRLYHRVWESPDDSYHIFIYSSFPVHTTMYSLFGLENWSLQAVPMSCRLVVEDLRARPMSLCVWNGSGEGLLSVHLQLHMTKHQLTEQSAWEWNSRTGILRGGVRGESKEGERRRRMEMATVVSLLRLLQRSSFGLGSKGKEKQIFPSGLTHILLQGRHRTVG